MADPTSGSERLTTETELADQAKRISEMAIWYTTPEAMRMMLDKGFDAKTSIPKSLMADLLGEAITRGQGTRQGDPCLILHLVVQRLVAATEPGEPGHERLAKAARALAGLADLSEGAAAS